MINSLLDTEIKALKTMLELGKNVALFHSKSLRLYLYFILILFIDIKKLHASLTYFFFAILHLWCVLSTLFQRTRFLLLEVTELMHIWLSPKQLINISMIACLTICCIKLWLNFTTFWCVTEPQQSNADSKYILLLSSVNLVQLT